VVGYRNRDFTANFARWFHQLEPALDVGGSGPDDIEPQTEHAQALHEILKAGHRGLKQLNDKSFL
jgi:hypothetical protein